jgi:hypothetical protein
VESIEIQPAARLLSQQMVMRHLIKLLLAIAAETEMEMSCQR